MISAYGTSLGMCSRWIPISQLLIPYPYFEIGENPSNWVGNTGSRKNVQKVRCHLPAFFMSIVVSMIVHLFEIYVGISTLQ